MNLPMSSKTTVVDPTHAEAQIKSGKTRTSPPKDADGTYGCGTYACGCVIFHNCLDKKVRRLCKEHKKQKGYVLSEGYEDPY